MKPKPIWKARYRAKLAWTIPTISNNSMANPLQMLSNLMFPSCVWRDIQIRKASIHTQALVFSLSF
jgi:hypothetical protein